MQLSGHYPVFSKKTLLVLTNNERARLFTIHERLIEETGVLETPDIAPAATPPASADLDAAKHHRREELYAALSHDLLQRLTNGDMENIILCVPEANKNDLSSALHPDVVSRVTTLVPKNLASMELTQVLRILFET